MAASPNSPTESAFQQAVGHHQAGRIREAETLYRSILQSQPRHPDANHNLGIIALQAGKPETAIPLLKLALEVNPNQGQFWLSLVEALQRAGQSEAAQELFSQAREKGLSGPAVEKLAAWLQQTPLVAAAPQARRKVLPSHLTKPSPDQKKSLFSLYQQGHLAEAEAFAADLVHEFPDDLPTWTILAATRHRQGQVSHALTAHQRVVELAPRDADAHNNLGMNLYQLGRLEEAKACFRQALRLKPNHAHAAVNLAGDLLAALGGFAEPRRATAMPYACTPNLQRSTPAKQGRGGTRPLRRGRSRLSPGPSPSPPFAGHPH